MRTRRGEIENADACRLDIDAMKIVEPDTPVMHERGADRFGVRDQDRGDEAEHGDAFDMIHHARLDLAHALAARGAARAAPAVPAAPSRIGRKRLERLSGPLARVDLIERGRNFEIAATLLGDRLGT